MTTDSVIYDAPLRRRGILDVSEDDLVACVSCGLCLPHCPTYRISGLERESPRGRITAMREVEFEGAPIDAAFVAVMDTCVQCRGCEAACPSSVPFGHLMEGAREAITRRARETRSPARRAGEWVAFSVVLPRHRLLLALTQVLALAQRARLVPRRLGVPTVSMRDVRLPLTADPDPTAFLFTGCVMDAWQRPVHAAAQRVMRVVGARVGLPGPGGDCCGALHEHAGRITEARALARRVIASTPGDAPVVVDSAGCAAAMKDYGRLLGTPEAARFAARVHDFSEWVAAQPPSGLRPTGLWVVVQDPCHLRHVQHVEGAVRTVLAPAYSLLETADDGLCCGAGGAYVVTQPQRSRAIRDRKVAAIRAAAGDAAPDLVVVSANPGCAMHLRAAGLDVRHPAELLAQALEES